MADRDEFTPTCARLAVLRALHESQEWDGPACELDAEAERILAVDTDSGTLWIVRVEAVEITPAGVAILPSPAPPACEECGAVGGHADFCSVGAAMRIARPAPPPRAQEGRAIASVYHEPGCTQQHAPGEYCRDASGVDLTIPF